MQTQASSGFHPVIAFKIAAYQSDLVRFELCKISEMSAVYPQIGMPRGRRLAARITVPSPPITISKSAGSPPSEISAELSLRAFGSQSLRGQREQYLRVQIQYRGMDLKLPIFVSWAGYLSYTINRHYYCFLNSAGNSMFPSPPLIGETIVYIKLRP